MCIFSWTCTTDTKWSLYRRLTPHEVAHMYIHVYTCTLLLKIHVSANLQRWHGSMLHEKQQVHMKEQGRMWCMISSNKSRWIWNSYFKDRHEPCATEAAFENNMLYQFLIAWKGLRKERNEAIFYPKYLLCKGLTPRTMQSGFEENSNPQYYVF